MNCTRLATVSLPAKWAISTPSMTRGGRFRPSTFSSPASPFFGSTRNTSGCTCSSRSPRWSSVSSSRISSRSRAAFSNSSAADAASISCRISSMSRFLPPSRNVFSRLMSRRYSSFEMRRLQGAVHWSMEASRQGRNHRHWSSLASMSSEQVRNLKIRWSTTIAPRRLPALVNGP